MIKIWAKLLKEDKIVKSFTLEKNVEVDWGEFFSHLQEICENLDIPTPVLLKTHIFTYAKFNILRFTEKDFVESIDFDKLVLENINR